MVIFDIGWLRGAFIFGDNFVYEKLKQEPMFEGAIDVAEGGE